MPVLKFSLKTHKQPFLRMRNENMAKIVLNAAKSPKFETLASKSWLLRTIVVTDLPSRSRLT